MIFSIPIPIFSEKAAVHYLHCTDEEAEKWKRKMVKKGVLPEDIIISVENSLGFCARNSFAQVIRMYEDPMEHPGTLAHEVMHAVWGFCRVADIPLSNDTEEVYAYLSDYITGEIYKKIQKYVD